MSLPCIPHFTLDFIVTPCEIYGGKVPFCSAFVTYRIALILYKMGIDSDNMFIFVYVIRKHNYASIAHELRFI